MIGVAYGSAMIDTCMISENDCLNPMGDHPVCSRQPIRFSMIVYFTRHAQSGWNAKKATYSNDIAWGSQNAQWKLGFDSATYQSLKNAKLTPEGIEQVKGLARAINRDCTGGSELTGSLAPTYNCKDFSILKGEYPDQTVVATSNLDRAINTAQIAYKTLLDKIPLNIISFFQEISSEIDAKTDSVGCEIVPEVVLSDQSRKYDLTGSIGDLNSMQKYGKLAEERFQWFCEWAFSQPPSVRYIAIAGHSSWLQEFWKTRNLGTSDLEQGLLKKKLSNSAILKFVLYWDTSKNTCIITLGQTALVYGTLAEKDKK